HLALANPERTVAIASTSRTPTGEMVYDAGLGAPPREVTVVGKHCESGDVLVRDLPLPADVRPGDLLAIPASGAYQRSMASNYNHVTRPPVVAVRDGAARAIVRRETEEDLLRLYLC
ncbi:hypothetical protein ABZ260_31080, partial [Streptosporangium sp. NPDC006013]